MENGQSSTSKPPTARRMILWIVAGIASLAAIAIIVWMLQPVEPPASASRPTATPTASATPSAAPSATPTPTPEPIAANTANYDPSTLPQVDVFSVIAGLPVDDDPYGALTGEAARPLAAGAPVFADPSGEPVAFLPRDLQFDGSTAPIIVREQSWVRVLLVGRQAYPSQGSPAQVTGWLRAQDVEITGLDATVEVSISGRTIDIVRGGVAERIATDFGSGAAETPTPVGRTYIMTTRVEPSFGYTRGYPLVYLAVQSPTLDGFAGANVAVTAFHYHDERSGPISNGCLRVDPAAIERLAQLPLGTPVIVRP
ncbi:L,D-transpeptidase family protein [uncultured Microbacterium sp.]|uniref:L,D-transpeptidase n=1 Tax=uncultured Microbacterium sp. TaxID=191216 RepID=UPI0028D2F093|nr:L,D-transpeptidase family protein [uncultured Microbacterium sp.]